MPLNNPVQVFGIRHHGPGSARALRRALQEWQPDLILVEGPPDAQDLLGWAAHEALQPPVALLVYNPEQPQLSACYPFAVFSPEWQALQYGLSQAIPVRFIDLPQAFQLAKRQATGEPSVDETAAAQDKAGDDEQGHEETELTPEMVQAMRLMLDPLAWAAEVAGYSDNERWWEHLVEQRHDSQGLFAAILELITALRQEAEAAALAFRQAHFHLESALEAEREAYMRQSIRAAQAENFERIAVVCGAWHAPGLADMPPAGQDQKLLKGLKKVKVAAAWVPWSYGRLTQASGYGAGIESPGWYDALWQAGDSGRLPAEITVHWMTQVARLLRAEGLNASSAHVIEAVRLAESLAALRDRPLPGLPELNEAVRAVFCFGDDLPLRLIHEKLVVSERLGQVPPDAPMTPLQTDLAHQQRRLRLPAEAGVRDLDLDLRNANDLERSHLLHRLALLEVPWGVTQHTGRKSGSFHEVWRIQWRPELAIQVVAASLWGNTIAAAADTFVSQSAEGTQDLAELTGLLNHALLANLPGAVQTLMQRLENQAVLSSDTGQLMDALPALVQVQRYGDVRRTDLEMVGSVVDGLVARICVGLPAACASLNDEAAEKMYARIVAVQQAVGLSQNQAYRQDWQATLGRLADQSGLHGLLAGRACAILLDEGVYDAHEPARRLGLAISTANEPAQAAAWAEGLLRGSGTVLLHTEALWQALDGWISELPGEVFTQLLPLLRRTFSTFSIPERRALGEKARHGQRSFSRPGQETAFDHARAEKVLPLLACLLGVDWED